MKKILQAIKFIHSKQIVHRDVKPGKSCSPVENIIL